MKRSEHFGRWAVCRRGIIGRVHSYEHGIWYGTRLDGGQWQSNEPRFIRDADVETLRMEAARPELRRVTLTTIPRSPEDDPPTLRDTGFDDPPSLR